MVHKHRYRDNVNQLDTIEEPCQIRQSRVVVGNCPSLRRPVCLDMFAQSRFGPCWSKQVLVPGVTGCLLGPGLAQSHAARSQPLQPQVLKLAGVGFVTILIFQFCLYLSFVILSTEQQTHGLTTRLLEQIFIIVQLGWECMQNYVKHRQLDDSQGLV